MGQGDFKVTGTSIYAAGDPTFIPNLQDPTKNHTMVTGIVNRGVNKRTGQEMSERITLHFWNNLASIAACFISIGKQFNIDGSIRVHTTDTGQVKNGKKVLNNDASIRVSNLELLSDSKKSLDAQFATSLTALIAGGRVAPNTVLTYDDFFPKKEKMQPFNPALAVQTGKYGHANVWSKDQLFWGGGKGIAAPATAAAPVGDVNAIIANLQAQLKALQGEPVVPGAQAVVGAAPEDPFGG